MRAMLVCSLLLAYSCEDICGELGGVVLPAPLPTTGLRHLYETRPAVAADTAGAVAAVAAVAASAVTDEATTQGGRGLQGLRRLWQVVVLNRLVDATTPSPSTYSSTPSGGGRTLLLVAFAVGCESPDGAWKLKKKKRI